MKKSSDESSVNYAQACFLFLHRYLIVGESRRQYKTPKQSVTRKDKDVDDSNNKGPYFFLHNGILKLHSSV